MLTAIVVVVVLTVLTALYVAAEFSAISVRRSRVRQMAEDGHFLALRLAPFVADARKLDTYIAASQIGITLTSLVLGAYGQAAITPTLAGWIMPWASGDTAWALSAASIATLVALTTFNVIVGELVPKTLALQYPTPVALATVMPMLWSLRHLPPVHRHPERQRQPRAPAVRRAPVGTPPRALARGARAADCREPRRRPARAGRASPAAACPAAAAALGTRADGAVERGRSGRRRRTALAGDRRAVAEPVHPDPGVQGRAHAGDRHPQHQAAGAAATAGGRCRVPSPISSSRPCPPARRRPAIDCSRSSSSAGPITRSSATTPAVPSASSRSKTCCAPSSARCPTTSTDLPSR